MILGDMGTGFPLLFFYCYELEYKMILIQREVNLFLGSNSPTFVASAEGLEEFRVTYMSENGEGGVLTCVCTPPLRWFIKKTNPTTVATNPYETWRLRMNLQKSHGAGGVHDP